MMNPVLRPGPYSVFLIYENGLWEQPTYRIPAAFRERDVLEDLEASDRKILFARHLAPDPDAPEDCIREFPKVSL